jgi:chromosome segregation ATPase
MTFAALLWDRKAATEADLAEIRANGGKDRQARVAVLSMLKSQIAEAKTEVAALDVKIEAARKELPALQAEVEKWRGHRDELRDRVQGFSDSVGRS